MLRPFFLGSFLLLFLAFANCSLAGLPKTRIAIPDFQVQGDRFEYGDMGGIVAEWMTIALVREGRFEIIERRMLAKLLEEQKLGLAGVVDSATASEVGKVIGVQMLITGTIVNLSGNVSINARIINVENAEIIAAEDAIGDTKGNLMGLVAELTQKIVRAFPIEGYVVERQGQETIIDIGKKSGVKPGMQFAIYKEGKVIKHPKTGAVLEVEKIRTGTLTVVSVTDKICRGKIMSESATGTIANGQTVVSLPTTVSSNRETENHIGVPKQGSEEKQQTTVEKMPKPDAKALFIELVNNGLSAENRENYTEAFELLSKALAIHHDPTVANRVDELKKKLEEKKVDNVRFINLLKEGYGQEQEGGLTAAIATYQKALKLKDDEKVRSRIKELQSRIH